MNKRTVVTHRRVVEGIGHVEVQFEKQAVDDDGTIYVPKNLQYHRTVFEVGCDIDAQMAAVNLHLERMGLVAVAAEEIAKIKRTSDAEWTPECVAAWEELKQKQALAAILTIPSGGTTDADERE